MIILNIGRLEARIPVKSDGKNPKWDVTKAYIRIIKLGMEINEQRNSDVSKPEIVGLGTFRI